MHFHNVRSLNVKDVWFDSYDEEGTLHLLAWAASLVAKQPKTLSMQVNGAFPLRYNYQTKHPSHSPSEHYESKMHISR